MTDVQATALVTPLPPSPPPKSDELPQLVTTYDDIATTEEDITANTDTSGNSIQNSSDCLQADQKAQQSLPTSEPSSSSSTTTTSIMPSTSSSPRTSLTDDTTTEQPPVIKKGILLIRPPPIARSASSPPSVSSSSTALPTTSNSTPPTPSITFAPLPALEPRRRTSSVQLGVAARSSMLRARRMRLIALGPLEGESDAPTSRKAEMINEMGGMLGGGIPGLEGFHGGKRIYGDGTHRVQYAAMVREAAAPGGVRGGQQRQYGWPEDKDDEGSHSGTGSRRPSTTRFGGVGSPVGGNREGEEEEEDAFVTLGRMVRGGAKTLWRSLSVGSMREKEKRDEKRVAEEKEKNRNVGGTTNGEDLSENTKRPIETGNASDSKASLHEEEETTRVLVDEPLVNEPTEVQTPQTSHSSPTSPSTEHHHKHHHPIEKQASSENEEYDVVDVEEVVEVEIAEVDDAEEEEEEEVEVVEVEEEEEEEGKVWIEQVDDNALQRRIERAQQRMAEQGKTKRGLKGRLSSLRIGGGGGRERERERTHGVLVR